jgi:type IV pilus assembly protein PilN
VIRINLLSVHEVQRAEGRRQEARLLVLGAVAVVAGLAAVEVWSRLAMAPVRAQHERLQADVVALDQKATELSDLEKKRSELDEKLKTIALLEQRRVGPVQIMSDLSDSAPDQVWLLEFTENAGAATITGMALDNQTIAAFMRQLAQSPYFQQVDLVETTQAEKDGLQLKRFVVRARLSYSGKPLEPANEVTYPEPPKTGPGANRPGERRQRRDRKGGRA